MAPKRERPPIRLLFDELLPASVARALHELGFRTSFVGNVEHGQPRRGSDDAVVLRHAAATNQVVVTSNHDMIMLCAELGQPAVWIDPYGRQFRHDELAVLAFSGIAEWHRLLSEETDPVVVRVLRTRVTVLSPSDAGSLAGKRMRALQSRSRRRQRRRREQIDGQLEAP